MRVKYKSLFCASYDLSGEQCWFEFVRSLVPIAVLENILDLDKMRLADDENSIGTVIHVLASCNCSNNQPCFDTFAIGMFMRFSPMTRVCVFFLSILCAFVSLRSQRRVWPPLPIIIW